MKILPLLLGAAILLAGCQTKNISEVQRFEKSVRKELPFRVDSLQWIDGTNATTYHFANHDYESTFPDAEIGSDGQLSVYRNFLYAMPARQSDDVIWRNVVVSPKNQRVICIDRYLREGKTQGYVYVLQSENKKYPTLGNYHWDVSDSHNAESLGGSLQHLRELTLKRLRGNGHYEAPASQDDYWTLLFHADSLFEDGLYAEAKQIYDLAFTSDRYILPSQLSTVAKKMMAIGNDEAAQAYLSHRIAMEPDFYEAPSTCHYPQLKDTFEQRQHVWAYNLPLKQDLEWILERDQYNRMLWNQAANRHPLQGERNEMLRQQAHETDSFNLDRVNRILDETGFPRKAQVGDFAVLAVWAVFQHNDLEHQKHFLPQLEEAVRQGEIGPMYVAAMKDRIDVFEGRPQKYGTQIGSDGKPCPLLDASRVNEWRQEVGLPPIELK